MCPKQLPRPFARVADCTKDCEGVDRWAVKILADRGAHSVDFTPRRATVAALGRLSRPNRRPTASRVSDAERRVYCVEAWIVEARPQGDGDLHLILRDPADRRSQMIAEVPEAACRNVCRSPWAEVFATARSHVEARLRTWQTDTLRVVITGVGFFDRDHGQIGAAPNLIELHPVLTVRFP